MLIYSLKWRNFILSWKRWNKGTMRNLITISKRSKSCSMLCRIRKILTRSWVNSLWINFLALALKTTIFICTAHNKNKSTINHRCWWHKSFLKTLSALSVSMKRDTYSHCSKTEGLLRFYCIRGQETGFIQRTSTGCATVKDPLLLCSKPRMEHA